MQKVLLSLSLLVFTGCTAPALKALELAPGDYCYAQSPNPLPHESMVRLTLSRQGKVTGEGQGFISQETYSYHARYQQTFTGQLVDQHLELDVTTTQEANRDDMEGHPPQSQEQWPISATELTPEIVPAPLIKIACSS